MVDTSLKFRKHVKRKSSPPIPAEITNLELGGITVIKTKDPKGSKTCTVIGNTIIINEPEEPE